MSNQEKLLENEYYMEWLEEYIKDKKTLTNDSSNDENIRHIEDLYKIIEKYAQDNYIYPVETKFGYYYIFRYKTNNYKIGYIRGHETFFYIEKTKEEAQLDFKEIQEGKTRPSTILIKLKLDKLYLLVSELSLVLPKQKIESEISKVYRISRR